MWQAFTEKKRNNIFLPFIWQVNSFLLYLQAKKKAYCMTTQTIGKLIADYFKTQPVLKAWIFGSYSRGEQREDSDIDI